MDVLPHSLFSSHSPASPSLCSLICTFLYMTQLSPASLQVPFFKSPSIVRANTKPLILPMCYIKSDHVHYVNPKPALELSIEKMPNSTIIHATFFAVGALVGGSVAAAVSTNKRLWPSREMPGPVEVGPGGKAQISDLTSLRYGNPGACKHQLGSTPHHWL
jgi:hypothetical protein